MAYEDLRFALDELNALLVPVSEREWSSWARRMSEGLAAGTATAADVHAVFASGYGIHDLVIHPGNGHAVTSDERSAVNDRLSVLRFRIFDLSTPEKIDPWWRRPFRR